MMRRSLAIDLRGFSELWRVSWKVFVVALLLGGLIAVVTAMRVEPRPYKPVIRIGLPGSGAEVYAEMKASDAACGPMLGRRSYSDILAQFELNAYSAVLRLQRDEPSVTRFNISEDGKIRARLESLGKEKTDSHLQVLIRDLNAARLQLLHVLHDRLAIVENRRRLLSESLQWVQSKSEPQASAVAAYLQEQISCNDFELEFLRDRYRDSQTKIVPTALGSDSMYPSKRRTLVVCLIIALIVASLAAILVGYARLLHRSMKEKDRDAGRQRVL
jgi:hypothetical protein